MANNAAKRKKEWIEKIDPIKKYETIEAINLVKELAKVKFNENIDVVFRLGIDPKKSDQTIRGACALPNGIGRVVRILAFVTGDKVQQALDAGADFAGSEEYVQKIQDGWLDFDQVIATPDMMATVSKIGKILGPRGLMPNPKIGTVTTDIKGIITNIKQGQVQFKTDKGANVHVIVGKVNFETEKIRENLTAIYEQIIKLKPSTAKGVYIKNISISSTMGPGIKIDPLTLK